MNFENLLNGSDQWGEMGGRHKSVGGRQTSARPQMYKMDHFIQSSVWAPSASVHAHYDPGSEIFKIKRENNSNKPVQ